MNKHDAKFLTIYKQIMNAFIHQNGYTKMVGLVLSQIYEKKRKGPVFTYKFAKC